MITEIVAFFNSWTMLITFICHSVVFACSLYVAVHNRDLRQWVVTPLWYLGILSGFTAATTVIQWSIGPENPMSYWTLGILGELSIQILIAVIMFLTFLDTVRTDLKNKKHRQK